MVARPYSGKDVFEDGDGISACTFFNLMDMETDDFFDVRVIEFFQYKYP